jgi:hypothetical protein
MADAAAGAVTAELPLLVGVAAGCDRLLVGRGDPAVCGDAGGDDAPALGADVGRRVAMTVRRTTAARHGELRL